MASFMNGGMGMGSMSHGQHDHHVPHFMTAGAAAPAPTAHDTSDYWAAKMGMSAPGLPSHNGLLDPDHNKPMVRNSNRSRLM